MIACQGWSYTTVREWEPSPVPDPCPQGSNLRRVLKSTEWPDDDEGSRGFGRCRRKGKKEQDGIKTKTEIDEKPIE